MKKSLYAKSMFMIIIILTLPFYISNAFAQTQLTVTKHSGDAGINGFFDSYDSWSLETLASVDGDSEITPDQIKVNDFPMQDCTEITPGSYTCNFESAYYSLAGGTYPSTVSLFSDDNTLLQSENINMTLDNLAPVIEFDRLPAQNGSIVSVAYTLKDRAWKEDDFSVCSGLRRVEFWDNSVMLYEQNITAPGCIYSTTTIVPLPTTGNLIIKAYDKMDHLTSRSSPRFELDVSPPAIQTDSFKMISQGVQLQQYIPEGTFAVNAQIKVLEDTGLQAKNIFADFSQFGEGESVPAVVCTRTGVEYTCTWPALQFAMATGTYNIKITARDDFGNVQEATVVVSFTVDTTAPEILSVATRNPWNAISYLGDMPKDIVATILDAGAGMEGRQALIDLSEVDAAYAGQYFQANRCEKIGANWECIWNDVKSSKTHSTRGNFYIIKMYDDAGNEATGVKQGSVYIDRKAPEAQELSEEQILAVTGYETVPRGRKYYADITPITEIPTKVLSSGDDMVVSVQVQDQSEIKAFADFSRIMGSFGYEETPGSCTTIDNTNWNCTWAVGPIGSGYLREDVAFTFVDSSGNNQTVKQVFEVFAKSYEENPDYWRGSLVSTMPLALDRSTTALINHQMYFHLKLRTSTGAQLVSVDLADCSGDIGYLNDLFIFNNERGSKEFFIGTHLKPFDAAKLENLTINCTFNLLSTYRKKFLMNYEKETIDLVVSMYDAPIGEVTENQRDKIDDLYDEWIDNGFWQVIGWLQRIFEWSDMLCKMYYTYRQIVMVWDLIKNIFGDAELATKAVPQASEPLKAGRRTACTTEEGAKAAADKFGKYADKYCAFINCKHAPLPEGKTVKGLEYWNAAGGGGGGAAWINRNAPTYLGKSALGGFQGTEDYSRAVSTSGGYMNVKDNFLLSLATLCLPGIVYNLHKYRAIHCEYISCLFNAYKSGFSSNLCTEIKDYRVCKYFWGAIFNIIPLFAFWNYVLSLWRAALSDPLALIGMGLAYGCYSLCWHELPGGHKFCMFIKVLSAIGDIMANIEALTAEDAWELTSDPCFKIEDEGLFTKKAETALAVEEE
ncbi:hypothetical protein KY331_05145 [Candidatus Woesearchaeota archaeon]|nr:hypothetical protein [Candidatus Woesearchaeota archaeon]